MTKLIFEKSIDGMSGIEITDNDIDINTLGIPEKFLRKQKVCLPQVSELETMRHFKELSDKNFCVESGFYPKICSDWQPIIAVLLLIYCKKFNIYDEVFENRYEYMKQLESFLSGFEYSYDKKHLQAARQKGR